MGTGRTVRHLASPYPVGTNPNYTAEVHVHWDADWSQDDQRYEARIYEEDSADEPIVNSKTADPVEVLAPPESAGAQTYYLEITRVVATGDEHFDVFPRVRLPRRHRRNGRPLRRRERSRDIAGR
jgi:hypothetical protein